MSVCALPLAYEFSASKSALQGVASSQRSHFGMSGHVARCISCSGSGGWRVVDSSSGRVTLLWLFSQRPDPIVSQG